MDPSEFYEAMAPVDPYNENEDDDFNASYQFQISQFMQQCIKSIQTK